MKHITLAIIFLLIIVAFERTNAQSDTLKIRKTNPPKEQTSQFIAWTESKSAPWITSLTLAAITIIVNLWISYSQRRTSLKVVKTQIESSMAIARTQFEFTLNSKNRQDWINELRTCISEFATHVRQLHIVFQRADLSSTAFDLNQKIFLYRSKIRLLLNKSKDQHIAFLQAQEELMNILEIHLLNNKADINDQYNNVDFGTKLDAMVEKGRELLYYEWQKVQQAQSNPNN